MYLILTKLGQNLTTRFWDFLRQSRHICKNVNSNNSGPEVDIDPIQTSFFTAHWPLSGPIDRFPKWPPEVGQLEKVPRPQNFCPQFSQKLVDNFLPKSLRSKSTQFPNDMQIYRNFVGLKKCKSQNKKNFVGGPWPQNGAPYHRLGQGAA